MSQGFHPTPEQLALAERRRLKREQRKATEAKEKEEQSRILSREWVTLQDSTRCQHTVRVMSWNLLAQCLVRRELFPTSDCLKANQRENMLYREILSHNAHICCLQEVDRTEKLLPILENAGYASVYASGPRKRHGCLIAYRKDMYIHAGEHIVHYDEQDVRDEGSEKAHIGSSFRTRNIASLVALKQRETQNEGVIVATSHLFWHPSYAYERARQAAVLLREVVRFRDEGVGNPQWPCIIAGDFNFQPDDPVYSLLVGDPLLPNQAARLDTSRVVHASIDPDVAITSPSPAAEDEEGEEAGGGDPDRVIVNARLATPEDGLLTNAELVHFFERLRSLRSVYDEGQRLQPQLSQMGLTFGSRVSIPDARHGAFEPVWTSYTHYWKAVLDYIFVLDPPSHKLLICSLAKPHSANDLGLGLPRRGIGGSDHISLGAELGWIVEQ
ncbi:hypothetical protein SCP_0111160 [Sparassis crispa]|uniref:Endonuclease/exonuclease/phosphatase domain-containing protein n=1 Tax=Sparassis crispa TaxID=139825 RepID=A0A401G7W0_9APHY|nr:hypothetical protein SCP_0111160 [Sparassis crispa]GBE78233.1 hypothetical protein SCP_0111160 [Sparassis crispa]